MKVIDGWIDGMWVRFGRREVFHGVSDQTTRHFEKLCSIRYGPLQNEILKHARIHRIWRNVFHTVSINIVGEMFICIKVRGDDVKSAQRGSNIDIVCR